MLSSNHLVVFTNNLSNKNLFIQNLLQQRATGELAFFNTLKGCLFSTQTIQLLIVEEDKHGSSEITPIAKQKLQTMSSGEQKKALLQLLLLQKPDYIILDNPYDNLDITAQSYLLHLLQEYAHHTTFIQIISRCSDCLPFITKGIFLQENITEGIDDLTAFILQQEQTKVSFNHPLPAPIVSISLQPNPLIAFKNVTVNYEEKTIVNNINWVVNSGEFWQLSGPNGAGKTTLLTMITGDNPKAYGKDLWLFGKQKGTGESVWEIKEKIGYLTPAMLDLFKTRHTVEEMVIAGFFDSIGLYTKPTEIQIRLANEWLLAANIGHLKNKVFSTLSSGYQRLILLIRAMVKHPPLLILDEPTAGLDDTSAQLIIAFINKIAQETTAAIIYVSHRKEDGVQPQFLLQLTPTENGSIATTQALHSIYL
ncbi:MAG: ABC transporter ATP-binding protein [Chitinophagaceae bacterium]